MVGVSVRSPGSSPGTAPRASAPCVVPGGLPVCAYLPATLGYCLYSGFGPRAAGDLNFLRLGSLLLTAPRVGGVHLYASVPELQMGPLTWIVGRLLLLVDPYHFSRSVWLVGLVLLLVTLRMAARGAASCGRHHRDVYAAVATGGAVLALGWVEMVHGWGHLDDAAALCLLITAWAWCAAGNSLRAGVALGAAALFQPVTLLALPLLLIVPRPRRSVGVALGVVAAGFLPFLLGAPATLDRLARMLILVQPGAVLHLFMPAYQPAPIWVRPAQLLVAGVVGVAAVRLRRRDLLIVAPFLVRLALDAADWPYYTVQVMLGLFVVEICAAARGARPVTWVGLRPLLVWLLLSFDPFLLPFSADQSRLVVLVAAAVTCLVPSGVLGRRLSLVLRARLPARAVLHP